MEHGGARPGAGRPAKGNVNLFAYVSPEDRDFIKGLAKESGASVGEVIHKLCESFKESAEK